MSAGTRGGGFPSGAACDRDRLVAWRAERLRAAGFSAESACRLARDNRVDLHAVLELIDRGCRPDLAARILAPLDWEPGWP